MSSNGRASLLPSVETRMNTPINLVVIIREVGREVCLFSQPVTLDFVGSEVQPHGPFHEPPDQQGKDEHEPECFDTPWGLEKQGIDKDRILEKGKVVLHRVLVLVDRE